MAIIKKRGDHPLSVRELLLETVGGPEAARSVHELHASDLTRQDPLFCPREVYLHRALDQPRAEQYVEHAMRITWDEGHDKQWRINNDYLRSRMWGHWRCTKCGEHVQWAAVPAPGKCLRGAHRWEYEEPVLSHPSGFTGSLDGVVQFAPTTRRMIEVKIMKSDDFKTLKAPLAEHRVRSTLYLRLIAEAEEPEAQSIDSSVAHVLYIMRGHGIVGPGGCTPFKEFLVHRDDKLVERYVAMSRAVHKGVPQGVCSTAMDKRAAKCAVAKQCFSGKYPPTVNWRRA